MSIDLKSVKVHECDQYYICNICDKLYHIDNITISNVGVSLPNNNPHGILARCVQCNNRDYEKRGEAALMNRYSNLKSYLDKVKELEDLENETDSESDNNDNNEDGYTSDNSSVCSSNDSAIHKDDKDEKDDIDDTMKKISKSLKLEFWISL